MPGVPMVLFQFPIPQELDCDTVSVETFEPDAMLSVPLRPTLPELACTENVTVPDPEPTPPDGLLTVIHGTLLVAVQRHVLVGADTACCSEPPALEMLADGDVNPTQHVHEPAVAACVTTSVRPPAVRVAERGAVPEFAAYE
jgi:hypothetical protein